MADDIDITPGTGATVATDEIDDRHYQMVKVVTGAAGTANPVSDANPVPVSDAGGALTVDGTVAVSSVAGSVAVTNAGITTLAGAVAGSEMQVDVVGSLPAGTATIGATKDAGPAWTNHRKVFASADQSSAAADITDAPGGGKIITLTDLVISVGTKMTVTIKEQTSGTTLLGPFYMAADSTLQITPRSDLGVLSAADLKAQVQTSVAGNISVNAGWKEA